jgi:hypothetical protein
VLAREWQRRTLEVCAKSFSIFPLTGNSGTTIHAWGAVTPNVYDVGKQMSYVKTCRPAHRRWKTTKVLIIDECAFLIDSHVSCLCLTLSSIHG